MARFPLFDIIMGTGKWVEGRKEKIPQFIAHMEFCKKSMALDKQCFWSVASLWSIIPMSRGAFEHSCVNTSKHNNIALSLSSWLLKAHIFKTTKYLHLDCDLYCFKTLVLDCYYPSDRIDLIFTNRQYTERDGFCHWQKDVRRLRKHCGGTRKCSLIGPSHTGDRVLFLFVSQIILIRIFVATIKWFRVEYLEEGGSW